jgi:cyclophilin family peptidyl-prolyl cis-trans isomerase
MRDIMITIKTNHGDIKVDLFDDKAPITCQNFRQYIDEGFFADTIFHRVIPNFMIQGGGMEHDMRQKQTRDPIKNEADNGESNRRGTLAMARTSDVNSATAQFFINLAVFGEVVDGMDVVDAIAAVKTGDFGGHQDVPLETVKIVEVTTDD